MISTPAIAGPSTRVRFIPELAIATAFISLLSGTMSETSTCRLGMFTAIVEPLIRPDAIRCQKAICPVRSSVATAAVATAVTDWPMRSMCLRGTLSDNAPPNGDTSITGRAKEPMTIDSASGESSASRSTSHALATICMFMPMKKARVPSHSQR